MKKLATFATALMILAWMWIIASYIEILAGNLGGIGGISPEYSELNLFMILLGR
jgi:hypothetical protein